MGQPSPQTPPFPLMLVTCCKRRLAVEIGVTRLCKCDAGRIDFWHVQQHVARKATFRADLPQLIQASEFAFPFDNVDLVYAWIEASADRTQGVILQRSHHWSRRQCSREQLLCKMLCKMSGGDVMSISIYTVVKKNKCLVILSRRLYKFG